MSELDQSLTFFGNLLETDILSFEEDEQLFTLCQTIARSLPADLTLFYLKKPDQTNAVCIAQCPRIPDQEDFISQIGHIIQLAISSNEELFQKTIYDKEIKQYFLGTIKKFQNIIFTIVLVRSEVFSETEIKILKILTHILAANTLFNGTISDQDKIFDKRAQSQLQNDFISIITHDMRNPLGCIKGYVTTLLRDDVEWPENTRIQFLQVINKETDRLSEMLTNFLETSRLQSGDYDLNYENIPSSDLLNELLHYNKLNNPNFTFHTSFPHNNPIIFLDKRKIKHAIQNLIENAIKHANISEIWITINRVPKGITIEIEDHGDGIPESRIKNIFNKFSRIPQIAPGSHGSGLGLYICKEIVNRHKGEISVHSTGGNGTTFIISLPLSPTDQDYY
ncbi:MAG: HAMP domain-containing histidine kinase [Anaerolineaceae bacterium]|nr:HAMP domain-containing histidine kinase [Anaerolineaceae bacterium]